MEKRKPKLTDKFTEEEIRAGLRISDFGGLEIIEKKPKKPPQK
jgi:hypothetical protein